MATDTRSRILRALRTMLAEGGTDSVTLEAVAVRAGVSKGGLLYHFPSKSAMYLGLLAAVRDTVVAEMADVAQRSGAARGFLEYAEPTADDEAGFFTSLIAAVRTGQSGDTGPTGGSNGGSNGGGNGGGTGGIPGVGAGITVAGTATRAAAADSSEQDAAALLVDIFRAWEEPMRAAVTDPVQAETIRLVGYGLYLAALAGLPPIDPGVLAQVFDRVLADLPRR